MITMNRLKSVLHYDPETGVWTCIAPRRSVRVGDIAGNIQNNGYRLLCIDGKDYQSSRLAVFYMTGEFPKKEVDHINGIKDDDRWANLRHADRSDNTSNRKSTNAIGVRGVYRDRRKYSSRIQKYGRTYFLGNFNTIEEAASAYRNAAERLHGNFAYHKRAEVGPPS